MALNAEGEEPEKKDAPKGDAKDGDPQEPEGEEPSSACAACNMAQEPNAKFCDQCGASMAATPDDGDGDDDAPDSDKKPGAVAPKAVTPPATMSPSASLASILGATSESPLALKTAAIQLRQIRDTAAGVTSQTTPDRIVGGLLSMPSRLEAAKKIEADRKVESAAREKADRWALCHRGIKSGAPEMARGKVFRDKIETVDGKPKRTAIGLQPQYAEMKLGTLRGLVEGYEASATKSNPFEPDRAAAEAQASAAQGGTPAAFTDADKKRLEAHPHAQMLARRGTALTSAQIVNSIITNDPQSARAFLTAQNGAAS